MSEGAAGPDNVRLKLDLPACASSWRKTSSDPMVYDSPGRNSEAMDVSPRLCKNNSTGASPAGGEGRAGGGGLSIECGPRLGSPRIQSLNLELLSSPPGSARAVTLEESWKGEILPDFLFLGDRVTASDIDRLRTLRITHIINATEDISNFFEDESPRLAYLRCPIKDRSDAAAEMGEYFPRCASFLDECHRCGGRALVHCRAGVSRSATIVIGYLMHSKRWDLKTSVRHVDSCKFVQPNSGFIEFLLGLERSLFGTSSMAASDFGYTSSASMPSVCPPDRAPPRLRAGGFGNFKAAAAQHELKDDDA
ncbi:hypothetical protein AB1Y20_021836 [Prymnesium parvum]|uniref:protein-tyrosine-phosphatase n=1 Tax=Prymnesium parvum TaxID=97485 RepID=A0AB34JKJ0_PRYPA|mmetsp:Transcript_6105/g.15510  ORF Transcript_6105/g.15510 Transcript_6105/m.15510 type:complete len:308 (+) Transcript_6105:158-1081(+)